MKTCKEYRNFNEQEKGFSIIEVLISLLIFVISIISINSILITSNKNLEESVTVLNLQKNGMESSAEASITAANISVNNIKTIPVNIQIQAPSTGQSQTCSSGIMGLVSSFVTSIIEMFFGSNITPATPSNPTSVTISVPMLSIQDPGNQNNNMAWWLP